MNDPPTSWSVDNAPADPPGLGCLVSVHEPLSPRTDTSLPEATWRLLDGLIQDGVADTYAGAIRVVLLSWTLQMNHERQRS